MLHEILTASLVAVIGTLIFFVLAQTALAARERPYVWASFVAHMVSAVVLILLTTYVFDGGDLFVYYGVGNDLADYLVVDLERFGPEVLNLTMGQLADLPVEIYGSQQSSTASLTGVTAWLMWLTGGSMYASGMILSFIAFSGQLAMYLGLRDHFDVLYHPRLLLATMLIPSVVFWSSGVVKEGVALAGLGWLFLGLHYLLSGRRRLLALCLLVVGGWVVALMKSYILFPFAVAGGAWWYWQRSLSAHGSVALAAKPIYMIGAFILAVVGVLALGEVFPEYSLSNLAEETAEMQYQGQRVTGGSNYVMGNPDERSLSGQLMFAPMALIAALFRPFIFEVHNVMALINALETTVITVLVIQLMRTRGLRQSWRLLRTSPVLIFCLVFVLLFGLGVGLATSNLGTLSRYRMPMLPMYLTVVLLLLPFKGRGQC